MPGKKKATGMSTRQSFLDRNVIAENNAIMRFNEDIENAARGISRPRASAHDRGREEGHGGAARPPRPARPPQPGRPPALPPEQEAVLRTAVAAATDDEAVASAGAALVGSLARGDRFERAGDVGWRALAEGAGAGERTLKDWDRLRLAWTAVRRAALTEWVKTHPDAVALQEKEEKAAARTERAANRRLAPRRGRPRRPPSGAPAEGRTAAAGSGEGQPGVVEANRPEPADVPAGGAGSGQRRRRPRRRRAQQPASQPMPVEDTTLGDTPLEDTQSQVTPLEQTATAPAPAETADPAQDAASFQAAAVECGPVLPPSALGMEQGADAVGSTESPPPPPMPVAAPAAGLSPSSGVDADALMQDQPMATDVGGPVPPVDAPSAADAQTAVGGEVTRPTSSADSDGK